MDKPVQRYEVTFEIDGSMPFKATFEARNMLNAWMRVNQLVGIHLTQYHGEITLSLKRVTG